MRRRRPPSPGPGFWRFLTALLLLLAGSQAVAAADRWASVRQLDSEGRTRDALQQLERRLLGRQADPEGQLLRGVLLAKLGQTDEAQELFQDLIREHPDLAEAYNNLAVMYAAAGDLDGAIEVLKRGLATHATYRTTYENLSKVYGKLASEAYSEALGEERIGAEPLRLALINALAEPPPAGPPATEPAPAPSREPASGPVVPAPEPMPVAAVPVPEEPAVPAAADETGDLSAPPEPEAVSETPAARDRTEAIWHTVEAWAAAWAGQRGDEYLSYYGPGFEPPGGAAREDWESLRRRRLSAPEFIRMSLALLAIEEPAPGRAVARFVQSYESDRFSDTVTKALDLTWTEAGWRIVRERVEAVAE